MRVYPTQELTSRINSVGYWYHTIELAPGLFTPGRRDCQLLLQQLDLPDDCSGLRALDIGANDGFFSVTLEKRGAEVIAVDQVPPEQTGFPLVREIYGSKVTRRTDNLYNITRKKYGQFDIVLCLGVMYHLRDPLLGLTRMRDVCRGELYLESFAIDTNIIKPDGTRIALADASDDLANVPLAQFYPKDELNGDFTSWWGYNAACLRSMLESTNFTVLMETVVDDRAIYKCRVNNDKETERWRALEAGVGSTQKLSRPLWRRALRRAINEARKMTQRNAD